MVLNPILLGAAWFIIHRYSVFHTFIWRGWVGGLSQMKLKVPKFNRKIERKKEVQSVPLIHTCIYMTDNFPGYVAFLFII